MLGKYKKVFCAELNALLKHLCNENCFKPSRLQTAFNYNSLVDIFNIY